MNEYLNYGALGLLPESLGNQLIAFPLFWLIVRRYTNNKGFNRYFFIGFLLASVTTALVKVIAANIAGLWIGSPEAIE